MSNRITEKMIQARIDYLNKITGNNPQPWSKDDQGRHRANICNYHLSHAYRGVCIHQMFNDGGGITTPLASYHDTKRKTYDALCAYLSGIEATS